MLIHRHTVVWDLAYFGRRSVANDIPTSTPLTREDMEWWLMRMETLYKSIQKAWPGVPIVMRKMQRASAAGAEARRCLHSESEPRNEPGLMCWLLLACRLLAQES